MKCDNHPWFSFLVFPLETNVYIRNKLSLSTYLPGIPRSSGKKNQQPICNFLENDGVNLGKKNYIFIVIGGILVLWNVLTTIFQDYWIVLTLPFLCLCTTYFSSILYYYSAHFPPCCHHEMSILFKLEQLKAS